MTSSYQIGPNGQGSPGAGTGTDGPAAGLAVQAGKQQPSAQQSAAGRPTAHARRDEQAGPPSQGLNNGGGAKIAPRPSYFLEINRRTLALFTGVMYLAKWTPYNSFAWIYTILTLLLPKKRAHGAEGAPADGQSRPGLHGNSGKTAARQRRARPCTQAPAAWPAVAHSTQATRARGSRRKEEAAALTEWQGSARGARGTCGAAEQTRRTGGGATLQLVRAALLTRSSAGARAVLQARAVVGSATAGQRGGQGARLCL